MHCPHCHSREVHKVSAIWDAYGPGDDRSTTPQLRKEDEALPRPNFPPRPPPLGPPRPGTKTVFAAISACALFLLSVVIITPDLKALCGLALAGELVAWAVGVHRYNRAIRRHGLAYNHWLNFYACNACGDLGLQESFLTPMAADRPPAPELMATAGPGLARSPFLQNYRTDTRLAS